MGNRLIPLENGEYYHIYNRGVDKRQVFMDKYDVLRFLKCMQVFNTVSPIGSLNKSELPKYFDEDKASLVNIVAYCLNPNHYHFILEQVADGGISEFMKRLSGGYTWYFNNKYERTGALFGGRFKSVHVDSDVYLKHLSAYVNLNFKVHKLSGSTAKLVKSSWEEYSKDKKGICHKSIVLDQFNSKADYKAFAESAIAEIQKNREELKAIELN